MSVSSINATIAALQSRSSHLRSQASAESQANTAEAESRRAKANEEAQKRAATETAKAPVRAGVGQVVDITV